MNRLRMLWCLALVVSSSALAQSRPWKVPYEFRIGQTSGFVTVVVRAVDDETDEVLADDTVNVLVRDWRFSGLMSVGATDAASATAMKNVTSLRVEYARASAPDTVLGTLRYSAPAYAMTLAPGAVITNNALLAMPALNVSGATTGLSAVSTTEGAAIDAEVTSTATAAFVAAVEGVANSASGAGGHFINTGGGQLLRAEQSAGAGNFVVENDGTAFTRGVQIPEFGPKGARGDTGAAGTDGATGPRGRTGPDGYHAPIRSFAVGHGGNSCVGVCTGRAKLIDEASAGTKGCYATSQQGSVTRYTGVCCLCGPL